MKYIKLVLLFLGMGTLVNAQKAPCDDDCCKKTAVKKNETALTCKLTTPELRERKATVIASLKKQVIEKKELKNGYAYKFTGSDNTVDEIANFIKTERMCCDFFTFNMSVTGDKKEAWLEITGPKGAKDFITTELEM
jgi:hypothetical protein